MASARAASRLEQFLRCGRERPFLVLGLAGTLLLAGSFLLAWFRADLPAAAQVLLGGSLLLGLTLFLRGLAEHLGPVFRYELVRSARRGQHIGYRLVYAGLLIVVLFWHYWSWFPRSSIDQLLSATVIGMNDRARFAAGFFQQMMLAQLAVVVLVTPLYTAGVIAEEKERRSFEFLLATDLSDREIVLGMLGARMANLSLLLLTSLPILGLLPYFGGVDPNLVLASFLLSGMLMLSLGSLSILVSVYAHSALRAVVHSYLWTFLYLGASSCFPCISCGNPMILMWFLSSGPGPGISHGLFPVLLLLTYCLVNGLFSLSCLRGAIRQVRRLALQSAGRPRTRGETLRAQPRQRPRSQAVTGALKARLRRRVGWTGVEENALLWKEIHLGYSPLWPDPRGPFLLLAGLTLIAVMVASPPDAGHVGISAGQQVQPGIRAVGLVLTGLMMMLIALSAARRVSQEREQHTLDGLLVLPVRREAILFAKWLGSIASARSLACCLAVLWVLGLLTGALHPVGLVLLVAAGMVYAGLAATLGLWFSAFSASTLRASLFTLLATAVVFLGPGIWLQAVVGSTWWTPATGIADWKNLLVDYGLTPPATLAALTFRAEDLLKGDDPLPYARIVAAVAGLYFYVLVIFILWIGLSWRFRAEAGSRRQ